MIYVLHSYQSGFYSKITDGGGLDVVVRTASASGRNTRCILYTGTSPRIAGTIAPGRVVFVHRVRVRRHFRDSQGVGFGADSFTKNAYYTLIMKFVILYGCRFSESPPPVERVISAAFVPAPPMS